ncbi:hypothetical protein CEUSTIGMA_g1383.t1 [Chlamydomonas eustigma]|uniref:Uncharacterized protein n=1 Tax=Chlamydomonas eustigma TaxID=1157962 RepID=A0A250WSY8_9CHLO|nr:hypothetical protein CEUSTIGMA_g1383.t1 [Chlamydomonas eustigma]|eukprot:GAX73933.1 hypothetical protein CEUSTIGMA_g1383.t1 [Chlamydomonas eustigma]
MPLNITYYFSEPQNCSSDDWKNLIFTQNPINSSDYKPLNSWSKNDFLSYIRGSVAPRSTLSLAFLAFAICCLFAFFAWRLLRCTIIHCCQRCKGTQISQDVISCKGMKILKAFGLLVGAGIMAIAIYGMVLPKGNSVQDGWSIALRIRNYSQQVVNAMDVVISDLQSTRQVLTTSIKLSSNLPAVVNLQQIKSQISGIESSLNQILYSVPPQISRFQQDTVVTISNVASQDQQWTLNMWQIFINAFLGACGAAILLMLLLLQAFLGACGAAILLMLLLLQAFLGACGAAVLLMLLLVVTSAFNCGWGMAACLVLQLLLVILFFILAAALAGLLILISDTCSNMNVIAVQLAPEYLKPIFSYYINPESSPASLDDVLATSLLINITQVDQAVTQQLGKLSNQIQPFLKYLPQSYQTLYQNYSTSAAAILSALGQEQAPASGVLGLARLQAVQPMYNSTQQFICCSVPNLASQLWTVVTVLGWLGIGLAASAVGLLTLLDQTQDAGRCCSASCLKRTTLPPAGKVINSYHPASSERFMAAAPFPPVMRYHGEPVVEVQVMGHRQ